MSLSREFAAFVAKLAYHDLPPEVVDRAKGVTLQALSSALVAHDMPASRQALALMREEEAGDGGAATVLCHGSRLTKAGAAFVNAETVFAGGKWDTFRMLTHPGIAILPAARLTHCAMALWIWPASWRCSLAAATAAPKIPNTGPA